MKTLAAPLALCLALVGPAVRAEDAPPPPANDPIARSVLPPELIMQHQKAIQLSEAQKNAVITEMKRAQARIVDLQWDMQRAVEPLVELLSKEKVDESQVLVQLDKVLAAEREFKRTQLTVAVRLKNILSSEQQRTLFELRSGGARGGEAPKVGGQKP